MCVCVPCPPLLLVSIIHSFCRWPHTTRAGFQQNLLPSPNLFLLLAICLSLSLCLQQYPSSIVSFHTRLCVHIYCSACICNDNVLSSTKCALSFFFPFSRRLLLTLFSLFLLMFPSVPVPPTLPLPPFLMPLITPHSNPSLSFSLFVSLSFPSLPPSRFVV